MEHARYLADLGDACRVPVPAEVREAAACEEIEDELRKAREAGDTERVTALVAANRERVSSDHLEELEALGLVPPDIAPPVPVDRDDDLRAELEAARAELEALRATATPQDA